MTVPTGEITDARLERWRRRLRLENATPIVLVGVGHDHKSGQIVICTLDDESAVSNQVVAALLRKAADEIERR